MFAKLQKLFNKQSLIILLMGLSSGLPIALTGGTLQAWMKSENVDLATIGLFAMVGLPYTFKFLWAPIMDRYTVLPLGRRRGWMLVSQILLIASVFVLSFARPQEDLYFVAMLSLLVAFFSSSQDIVIDAWRREALPDDEQGWGSSVHISSYLFGMRLVSGAFALILSDFIPFGQVYQIMAVVLGLGVIATLLCHEPKVEAKPPRTLQEAVISPFKDYFSKDGAWLILIFILLYKVGDNMAAHMTMPFYLDLGFSRTEVGAITKVVGWVGVAFGGLLGGALILRWKIVPSLFIFGILQAISTLFFAGLALIGKSEPALAFVIGFENFTAGMGSAAFVAFMAVITNKKFTATQFALLTSLMGVPRIFAAAPTGYLAEHLGWVGFFVMCSLVALPGLALIRPLQKKKVA